VSAGDEKSKGKRGGGPKSRDGKARTSLNALKHGLTSLRPQLLEWESASQFRALSAALIEELAPEGVIEAILVDRIVWCAWRLRRAARVEQLLLTGGSFEGPPRIVAGWVDRDPEDPDASNVESEPDAEELEREREQREAAAMIQYGRDAGLLTRYETTLERSLYRALWQLRELQAARREERGPKRPPGFTRG
jgi:hypothetical protein